MLSLFVACIKETIEGECPYAGGSVHVKIHWDKLNPGENLPLRGMHIQLFPNARGAVESHGLGVNGGVLELTPGATYQSVCFDYESMEYLEFRDMDDKNLFEAYLESAAGTYSAGVKAGNDEPVVHEPYPYEFYVDTIPEHTVPPTGADTLHCYPHNALHEITYLVYGVEGVENAGSSRGTISGMSGAYHMTMGQPSGVATVLFRRSLLLANGRSPEDFTWNTSAGDEVQYVSVEDYGSIPVLPGRFPATGWEGGWAIGAFSVFGQPSLDNQLTIECFSHANYHYYASWGYWQGEWEETVSTQIRNALGYWNGLPADVEEGSYEAKMAWRAHNGGFDIVLANNGRLTIPPDVGLIAPVTGWDGIEIPLN
jgi:hypothetical protein